MFDAMKPLKALDVLIAALALAAYAGPAQAGREDLLTSNLMNGNVQVKTDDTGDWVSREDDAEPAANQGMTPDGGKATGSRQDPAGRFGPGDLPGQRREGRMPQGREPLPPRRTPRRDNRQTPLQGRSAGSAASACCKGSGPGNCNSSRSNMEHQLLTSCIQSIIQDSPFQ